MTYLKSQLQVKNKIKYVHITHTGNLGDELCSPRHYFNCTSAKADTIMGGGVQTRYILGEKQPPKNTILWGAGSTGKLDENTMTNCDDFLAWGIRDKSLVTNEHNFLPCVSALHPMLDLPLPKAEKTLLHINADPRIYSYRVLKEVKKMAEINNSIFITNRAPEKDFVKCLAQSSHIITSSYHGAYWGLLSGRTVTLMGYSFKFESLLNILNLEANYIPFIKGNQETLIEATKQAFIKKKPLKLDYHKDVLKQFRDKQLNFSKTLEDEKLLNKCELKTFDATSIIKSKQNSEFVALNKYYANVNLRNFISKFRK